MVDQDESAIAQVFEPASAAADCHARVMDQIVRCRAGLARPAIVGLCGPQGSGKSTMAGRLAQDLAGTGLRTAILSLDDFYLRRSERQALASEIHPLLATRGVPGTHDIGLALERLSKVLALAEGARTTIPAFDKLADDRTPPSEWREICGPLDIVLIEGWCVGAPAQATSELGTPVNALERDEDQDGRWRTYVNDQLRGPYQQLFQRLDLNILLRAPTFGIVRQWRAEQEAGHRPRPGLDSRMDETALLRFVAHYQRLTCWMHKRAAADLIVDLGRNRVPLRCREFSRLRATNRTSTD